MDVLNLTSRKRQSVPNHLMDKVFSVRFLNIRGVMPTGVGLWCVE